MFPTLHKKLPKISNIYMYIYIQAFFKITLLKNKKIM